MPEQKRIAAIVTTFFPNSHAGVLASKFLTGFATDEEVAHLGEIVAREASAAQTRLDLARHLHHWAGRPS